MPVYVGGECSCKGNAVVVKRLECISKRAVWVLTLCKA